MESGEITEIKIRTVSDYIENIAALKRESISQGASGRFFFRGQKNKAWEIRPSAFRNNLLSRESELIKDAYLRAPLEFSNLRPFEQLTKLQHYGLPTRLLDVTLNPLVALYFACESYCPIQDVLPLTSEEAKEAFLERLEGHRNDFAKIIEESDGCVFYKEAYDVKFDSAEINLICQLAERDLSSKNTILELSSIIEYSHTEADKSAAYVKQHYTKLAHIFNSNYFVTSTFNNPRLIRQSGAFLLPACFYIHKDADHYENSIIEKRVASLNKEFESTIIVIPADCKQSILEELDLYNINRGTLFPELEHQMAYVRDRRSMDVSGVENFAKNSLMDDTAIADIGEAITPLQDDVSWEDVIQTLISDVGIRAKINEEIRKQQSYVDWFKKDSILSELNLSIRKILMISENNKRATELADQIIDEIQKKYK